MYKALAKAMTALAMLSLGTAAHAGLDEVARMLDDGRYQAALEQLAGEAKTRRARLLKADALSALKRSAEAESLYQALIDEQPQDPTPYNNLAALYASTGRLQEATEVLTRAIQIDPRYAAIYKNLSRVYVEMSRKSYAKALRIEGEQKGVELSGLDYRDTPSAPLQLAAVAEPAVISPPEKIIALAPPPARVERVEEVDAAPETVTTEPEISEPEISERETTEPEIEEPKLLQGELPEFDAGGAISALKRWSAAWSAQDVEGYLAAYDNDFQPPRDLSLSAWQAERRQRLRKPTTIEVSLSDFEVSSRSDGALTVTLRQRYRSDNYRDTTRKGFILVPRAGEWKIYAEYTIEVIN